MKRKLTSAANASDKAISRTGEGKNPHAPEDANLVRPIQVMGQNEQNPKDAIGPGKDAGQPHELAVLGSSQVSGTLVSLKIDASMDDKAFAELGRKILAVQNAAFWWICDYILEIQARLNAGKYSRHRRRDGYDRALKLLPGFERSTLQKYAWIGRSIPKEIRSDKLSIANNALIANLAKKPDTKQWQRFLIRFAEKRKVTPDQLRHVISDLKSGKLNEILQSGGLPPRPATKPEQKDDGLNLFADSLYIRVFECERKYYRIFEWYKREVRKTPVEAWPEERKAGVLSNLKPLFDLNRDLMKISEELKNSSGR